MRVISGDNKGVENKKNEEEICIFSHFLENFDMFVQFFKVMTRLLLLGQFDTCFASMTIEVVFVASITIGDTYFYCHTFLCQFDTFCNTK